MNYQGKIKKWNDERGFGFIHEDISTAEIFAHVSAFQSKTPRPQVGEAVSFQIVTNAKGKKEARNIRYLHRPVTAKRTSSTKSKPQSAFFRIFANLLTLAIIGFAGYFIYTKYLIDFFNKKPLSAAPISASSSPLASAKPSPNFSCDGRTHCSQMRSCAEAKFFLKHCPNTKMDGDRDGIPCEQQLCSW